MNRRVGIISYGTGNLASLADAFGSVGATCTLVNTASDLAGCDALVLPGVGHFGHAMNFLRSSGLLQPTMDRINLTASQSTQVHSPDGEQSQPFRQR